VKSDYSRNFSQIGGRWAISLRAGIAIFPIFLFSIPILEANLIDYHEFLRWTWVSLLASIPAGLFLYLAHLTYFRNRIFHPRPPASVFLLGFLLGAIKGSLVEFLALRFGLASGNEVTLILIRTLNSAILSAIICPLIALTLVTTSNFRTQKRELLEQLVFVQSQNAQTRILNAEEEVTPEELRSQINELLSKAKVAFEAERSNANPNISILIEILRAAAEDVIRPLSHTLYEKSLIKLPKTSPFQLFKILSVRFQIEIPVIICAYILFSFKNIYVSHGFGETVKLISERAILLGLILWIFRALFSRVKITLFTPFIWASILGILVFVLIDSASSQSVGYETDLAKIVLSFIWNLSIVLVSGYLIAISDVNRYQLESLKSQISKAQVIAHAKDLRQRYLYRSHSKILHGVYHSRLIACAVAISTVGKSEDLQEMNSELDRAQSLLEIDFETHVVEIHDDPESILNELKERWSETLDINFELDGMEGISSYQLLAMNEFLSESLVNAFRHGRATQAQISCQLVSQGELQISVTDDGVGYIPSHPGLGSAIFDELSNGTWEIYSRIDSHGTVVSIVIQPEELK